jgi:hypothetical protein
VSWKVYHLEIKAVQGQIMVTNIPTLSCCSNMGISLKVSLLLRMTSLVMLVLLVSGAVRQVGLAGVRVAMVVCVGGGVLDAAAMPSP